jgi:hypothetical protein
MQKFMPLKETKSCRIDRGTRCSAHALHKAALTPKSHAVDTESPVKKLVLFLSVGIQCVANLSVQADGLATTKYVHVVEVVHHHNREKFVFERVPMARGVCRSTPQCGGGALSGSFDRELLLEASGMGFLFTAECVWCSCAPI